MNKFLLACLMCAAAVIAQAAPGKAASESWGQDYRRLKDKASDALALRDSTGASRAATRAEIDKLTQRAAKTWGESSSCHRAAQTLLMAYDETGNVTRQGGHVGTSSLFRFAMETGQSWAGCRDDIDAAK